MVGGKEERERITESSQLFPAPIITKEQFPFHTQALDVTLTPYEIQGKQGLRFYLSNNVFAT